MNHYPTSIRQVIRQFSKLPGIGEKTAERLAMYILRSSRSDADQLARSISELKDKVRLCSICFSLSESEHCNICTNPSRDNRVICVVEQPADMVSIEKSGAYNGKYHVLQGALSPMDGIGPDAIRIKELIARIGEGNIQEIILATGTHVEGEATASYLLGLLEKFPVKVTRIASGVPIGGDLKYIDQVTLKRAMETRYAL
jgi:recombination protein RecR